jgi:hypothetical protein
MEKLGHCNLPSLAEDSSFDLKSKLRQVNVVSYVSCFYFGQIQASSYFWNKVLFCRGSQAVVEFCG